MRLGMRLDLVLDIRMYIVRNLVTRCKKNTDTGIPKLPKSLLPAQKEGLASKRRKFEMRESLRCEKVCGRKFKIRESLWEKGWRGELLAGRASVYQLSTLGMNQCPDCARSTF